MKKTKRVVIILVSFIVGVLISSIVNLPTFYIYSLLLISLVVFLFLPKKSIIVLSLIVVCLGVLRFNVGLSRLEYVDFGKQKVEIMGQLVEVSSKVSKKHLVIETSMVDDEEYRTKLLVIDNLYPDIESGSEIVISCQLKRPGKIDRFDWGEYLKNRQITHVCYYPKYISVEEGRSGLFALIKYRLLSRIHVSLPQIENSLVSAVILGDKSEVSPKTRDMFSKAGLSHVMAISGLHISILTVIIFYIFIYFGVSHEKSFKYIVLILLFYLLLIGFKASAVRAFVMGVVLAYGMKIGRLSDSGRAVLLAGVLLLIINPRLLLFGVGFALSFSATLGIIYFYPYFSYFFKKIFKNELVSGIASMSLAAQLATWPLVAYNFGVLSVFSPITNLLVIPVLPVIFACALIFVLCTSFIAWPYIFPLSVLCWLLFKYIYLVAYVFSYFPFMYIEVGQFSLWILILVYLVIISFYFLLQERYIKDI